MMTFPPSFICWRKLESYWNTYAREASSFWFANIYSSYKFKT